jgi:adenylate cyclase class 2
MRRSRREIEVKLPFDSPTAARERLEALGARLIHERRFEDNVLFDRDENPLKTDRKLLRVRRDGPQALLTYKAPVPGQHRHKTRLEEETAIADPDSLERILDGLGFSPVYRYQKYRTLWELGELHVCLDETPLGCFVELEGEPQAIDDVAARLGFGPDDYVLESYLELHARWAAERGEERGDMVFRVDEEPQA